MALGKKQQAALDLAVALVEERLGGATYEQTIQAIVALSESRGNLDKVTNGEWIMLRSAMQRLVSNMLADIDFALSIGLLTLKERDDLRLDFVTRLQKAQTEEGFKILG